MHLEEVRDLMRRSLIDPDQVAQIAFQPDRFMVWSYKLDAKGNRIIRDGYPAMTCRTEFYQ